MWFTEKDFWTALGFYTVVVVVAVFVVTQVIGCVASYVHVGVG